MSNILGVSSGFHDAAVSLINNRGEILFAAHSERYSKLKNDPGLDPALIKQVQSLGFDHIAYYERPWAHNLRRFISGERNFRSWSLQSTLEDQLGDCYKEWRMKNSKIKHGLSDSIEYPFISCFSHHLSHAAAGFQTSPFDNAAVVVIDAIGELDTISIYRASYDSQGRAHYKRMWRQTYPHSIGLFYSAVTKAVGLKPMDEEYITMGMAAYGSDLGAAYLMDQVVTDPENIKFYKNLHIGFDEDETKNISNENLAAAAQGVTETLIMNVMRRAKQLTGSGNLVYMGGVALNCVANRRLGQIFNRIWIMPNPGDAGSSLGAAALVYGRKLQWRDAFLGHEIPGEYPVKALLDELIQNKIVGVASGRAEFGPRALGNRSLLADPRGPGIKDRVNEIKRRQKFRPFAPVILEELVHDYFDMPRNWPTSDYMQIVATVKQPDLYPAITHADNTARVQTVSQDGSGIRQLLEQWYLLTGCPMLLNTSLNIRGEPIVNDRADADRFEHLYGVRVCS
jgi:carbamoyltransferase